MKRSLLTLAAFCISLGMWAQYAGSGVFKKITELADLEDGAYYVLYGMDGDNVGAFSNDKKQTPDAEAVLIADDKITDPSATIVWKLVANGDNWRLFSEDGNFYSEVIEDDLKFSQNETDTPSHDYAVTVESGAFKFISNHPNADSRWIGIGTDEFKPYQSGSSKQLFLYKLQSALDTPITMAATDVSTTGFTANWSAVNSAMSYELSVYEKKAGVGATDLIISQYYAGKSYDKAIELFNGTNDDIDLSNYSLMSQSNGAGDFGKELVLSGSLPSGATYVITENNANTTSELQAKADLVSENSIMSFNGNDTIALYKDGVMIDIIGTSGDGDFGEDKTLTRATTVSSPNATYTEDEWSVQRISEALQYIDDLGVHSMDVYRVVSPITGSPFSVGNVTTYALTGLTPETTYVYSVVAMADGAKSTVSNKTEVTTFVESGIGTAAMLVIDDVNFNGLIIRNANKQVLSIYNAAGVLMLTSNSDIDMSGYAPGMYVVRSAKDTLKIMR